MGHKGLGVVVNLVKSGIEAGFATLNFVIRMVVWSRLVADLGGDPFPRCGLHYKPHGKMWPPLKTTWQFRILGLGFWILDLGFWM